MTDDYKERMNRFRNWLPAIYEALDHGQGREYALKVKHLNRAIPIEMTDTHVTFEIERHPHMLGHRTKGLVSSAFVPTWQTFKFDDETGKLELLSEKKGEPEINYDMLASEQLDQFEFGDVIDEIINAMPPEERKNKKAVQKAVEDFAGDGYFLLLDEEMEKQFDMPRFLGIFIPALFERAWEKAEEGEDG